ncbi:MAG: phosphatidylserine decarboxylase family protein [Rubrivivax sp.]|nr:MAG: phosphatidylserine decarboxylase family protein [Rubrivivax sp.]
MTHPLTPLAREGWPFLALATGLATLATCLWGWGLVSGILWLALLPLLLFFRDSSRAIPTQSGAILSPADGRILKVEKVRDHYANRDALRISVFMSVFSAHTNRSCVDGVVKHVQYFPRLIGKKTHPGHDHTERNAMVIESGGQIVTLVQVAGQMARHVLCHAKVGDTLTRGQRYGLIRFGSRVDVYLPPHAVPLVASGQRVSATTTILATLPKA